MWQVHIILFHTIFTILTSWKTRGWRVRGDSGREVIPPPKGACSMQLRGPWLEGKGAVAQSFWVGLDWTGLDWFSQDWHDCLPRFRLKQRKATNRLRPAPRPTLSHAPYGDQADTAPRRVGTAVETGSNNAYGYGGRPISCR
ncbi:hypothetical protein F5Y11DRAFT_32441 [Daldinia sp. FL1419]|nr:hypothetical protein F5Y11DRAFT_32441 [Daldinia sp. FL1419]